MTGEPAVVVAGDVCIDWLSIPLDPVSVVHGAAAPDNWQIQGGRRMYARRGGALLTAKFTRDAAGNLCRTFGPTELPQEEIDSLSPDKLIHSLATLDRCRRESAGRDFILGVTSFEGFAGPAATAQLIRVPMDPGTPDTADVVLLDDAGNGFRNWEPDWAKADEPRWPRAIGPGKTPLVIYKLRRPLPGAQLGIHLRAHHADRTIALLDVEELRAEADGAISRSLSWERTATDTVVALNKSPHLRLLLSYAHLVIPLGLEGVLHVEGGYEGGGVARLWYCPEKIEGDLSAESRGTMIGFASALAAALAVHLAKGPAGAELSADTLDPAIRSGMKAARRLFDVGFGVCRKDGKVPAPEYPGREIFDAAEVRDFPIYAVDLARYPRRMAAAALTDVPRDARDGAVAARYHRDLADFRAWRILDATREGPYAQLAERIVREGVDKALPRVPVARFGGLELIDRQEIESYRTIRNLIREFLKTRKTERPLCLAVFGAPGAGKSFGVVQVAKALSRANPEAGDVEKFEFNVSQWQAPSDLAHALHHVRDSALRGNVPLVFFDEFDCSTADGELAWLKFFLAPMQDGVFNDGASTHVIGRAIFVFAGGTSWSYAEFQKRALSGDGRMVAAKAPDFLSRLRGYVDVQSIGKPVGVQLIRRALLLRSFLVRKCKHLIDPKSAEARVKQTVIRALLNVSRYQHGVRSIEAILDMSRLGDYHEFSSSLLPPAEQLDLHVPSADFQALLNRPLDLGDRLDQIARLAHEAFVASLAGKRDPAHSTMQPWDRLASLYKNSNREQAAHIPVKLAAVGCDFRASDAPALHVFADDEIERMAVLEHDRWMEERRPTQRNRPSMVKWEDLPEEEKNKDRESVRQIPEQLRAAGLEVYRLD